MADMVFTISQEALKLIQSGEAVLSSGGVRSLTGQLIELAKPGASSGLSSLASSLAGGPLNIASSVVNAASSLANNVQSAMIIKDLGVVGANVTAMGAQIGDVVTTLEGVSSGIGVINSNVTAMGAGIESILTQCTSISAALGSLQQIAALSWVNTAFSLANCGISIVSFYATMNKLNGISKLMEDYRDQYNRDREYDTNEKFWNCYLNLRNDVGNLRMMADNKDGSHITLKGYSQAIEEHINAATSFIQKLLNELTGKVSKNKTNIKIILSLYVMLAQTINEYCCLYYYSYGKTHHMLEAWNSFLSNITSEDFHYALRQHLMMCDDYISIHPEKKKEAYLVSLESTTEVKSRFETCRTVIDQLPEGEYYNLDDILNRQLYNEIQTQIPALKNLDETLTENIMNNQFFTSVASKDYAYVRVAY